MGLLLNVWLTFRYIVYKGAWFVTAYVRTYARTYVGLRIICVHQNNLAVNVIIIIVDIHITDAVMTS